MKKALPAVITLAIALGLSVPAALAQHGDQGEHGNPHQAENDHQHGNPHARGEPGWERRGNYEYSSYGPGNVPPGWSRGKKTGWGNCGMPPGQAKKYGCRTYTYQGRSYYYYQNEAGQIMVRRPVVEVHGGVDIVP
ncbi:MAG TPA: hypothetical protein VKV05_01295 [Terriglobales bacterium]|nr:hypothetical protein [Terriglobales bacterium]